MADDACPTSHCGRPMRRGSLVCRRCWSVPDDDLKQAYLAAREVLRHDKTVRNIDLLLEAKQRILDSITPRSTG